MELNEFRNNTKVNVDDELISSIVEGFVKSDLPFYNKRASLMACLDVDSTCAGKVDSNDNDNFMNLLMLNMCFDKCHGKAGFKKLDKNAQMKMGEIFYRRIKKQIFECGTAVYDYSGINQTDDYKNMEHEFIIKVMPENFIPVLQGIYKGLREQGLDSVRIITPSTRFICVGYNAPIKVRCSTENLESTVNFLNELSEDIVSKTMKVHKVYDTTGTWYGYEQVNKEGITAPSVVASAVYEAIKIAAEKYTVDEDLIMPDGSKSREYYQNQKNKFVATRKIVEAAMYKNYDAIMIEIVELSKYYLSEMKVNLADCLRFEDINQEVEKLYGKELDVQALFNARVIEQASLEKENSGEPRKIEKSEEEKRLEELAKKAEEEFGQNKELIEEPPLAEQETSAARKAYLKAKREIAERKAELEEIIRRSNSFPSGYETEEDMDRALNTILGGKEIQEDETFASKDYTSRLGSSLFDVLNGADPEEVAKFNDAIDEYRQLQEAEAKLEAGEDPANIIIGEDTSKKEEVPAKVEEVVPSKKDGIKKMSDGIDRAIQAIIDMEEREKAQAEALTKGLNIPGVAIKGTIPEEDPNKVITIPTEEQVPLEGFATGKTEVLTEVVDKVKEEVKHDNDLKDTGKKAERVNPDSPCLDYITEDDVLIPDLKDVAYHGNDLIEALRTGGNVTDPENVAAIANHFGMDNYSGLKEQQQQLLDILRHLAYFDMDGTILGTGIKPLTSWLGYINVEEMVNGAKSKQDVASVSTSEEEVVEQEVIPEEEYLQPTTTTLNITYNPRYRDSFKYKYSGYVDDTGVLDTLVAGTEYTVLDYFEFYDLFTAFKSDEIFVLHEDGKRVKGKDFVEYYLIPYLTNYGPEELQIIVGYFVEEILPPEKPGRRNN